MIPLRDDIPSRTIPFMNLIMIGICSVAFFFQVSSESQNQQIINDFAFVPLRLTDPTVIPTIEMNVPVQTPRGIEIMRARQALGQPAVAPWMTLVTCMFLHGGWMHFLGNMWFLYIFGDNVEDRCGHFGYLILYLGTGVLAGLSHLVFNAASPIPTLGASGAIAGVMGAYAWLYPHARVLAVLPIIVFLQMFVLPAPVFLGIWFVFQLISGVGSMGAGAAAGVAWWAHAGGFVAGAVAAFLIGRTPFAHDAVVERRF